MAVHLHAQTARPLALARWLLMVAGLVFALVVVGGITRLTESGMSITRWDLVSGTLPPLSDAAWGDAFDLYKATPEYREINGLAGMDLAQFKVIFLTAMAASSVVTVLVVSGLAGWIGRLPRKG